MVLREKGRRAWLPVHAENLPTFHTRMVPIALSKIPKKKLMKKRTVKASQSLEIEQGGSGNLPALKGAGTSFPSVPGEVGR